MHTFKSRLVDLPKVSLIIGGIGVSSFVGALLIVAGNNTAQANLIEAAAKTNTTESRATGVKNSNAGATVANQAGSKNAVGPKNAGATQTSAQIKTNGTTTSKVTNTSSAASTINPTTKKPALSSAAAAATTPRTGYNLNENWYFASIGAAGDYNSCWPAAITLENEAECLDPNNANSGVLFEGIGISKNAMEAEQRAAAQLTQKLSELHIEPRRGGGGDANVLTETMCISNGLTCGRW